MTEKELKQYHCLCIEIAELENDLAEITIVKSPTIGAIKGTTIGNPTRDTVIKITELKNTINKKLEELYTERIKLENYINAIENKEIRVILRLKYIKLYTWRLVAHELGVTKQTIWRKYNKFIKNVTTCY